MTVGFAFNPRQKRGPDGRWISVGGRSQKRIGRRPPFTGGPAGLGPEPNSSHRHAYRTYWKARQDALPVDFKGERLEPAEVRFVERFLDVGETPEWIATKGDKPTNDFIWRSNGNAEVEQKTVVPRPQSIHGRIVDAASRAAKHGAVKDRFIIDIEDSPLTDEIRIALEQFNVGREKYRLRGLWVMAQGQLHVIDLKK